MRAAGWRMYKNATRVLILLGVLFPLAARFFSLRRQHPRESQRRVAAHNATEYYALSWDVYPARNK